MSHSFLVQILIQKGNTDDKVLENKLYIRETKEKKRKEKKRKEKVLQIHCYLRDISLRECPVNKVL